MQVLLLKKKKKRQFDASWKGISPQEKSVQSSRAQVPNHLTFHHGYLETKNFSYK